MPLICKVALGISLVLALGPPAGAEDWCRGRIKWTDHSPSQRPSCVTNLKPKLETAPNKRVLRDAARCVLSPAEGRAARMAELAASNACLAETLMLFEELLAEKNYSDDIVQRAYEHYVINTPGLLGADDPLDPVERGLVYARRVLQVTPERETLEGWRIPHTQVTEENTAGPCAGSPSLCDLRAIGQSINMVRYGRVDVIPSTLFPFRPDANRYDAHNAMWMADLAELVYHDWSCERPGGFWNRFLGWFRGAVGWTCSSRQLRAWEYEGQPLRSGGTEAFVARKGDHVVIAFRGSRSLGDYVTDLNAWLVKEDGGGKVHRGFQGTLDAVWGELKEELKEVPRGRVFVTGHSLGGALAQLAAYRIERHQPGTIGAVYGYGSPRVGNRVFANLYSKLLGDRTFLHVNGDDPVPLLPTWLYVSRTHVGRFSPEDHGFRLEGFVREGETQRRPDQPQLTPAEEQALLSEAEKELAGAMSYLTLPLERVERVGYSPEQQFNTTFTGYHRASQYLFKLACLTTEKRYLEMGGAGRSVQ